MKKLFTLAVLAALAVSAQAAQITWTNTGNPLKDDKGANITQASTSAASLQVYLINDMYLASELISRADLLSMLAGTYTVLGTESDNVADYAAQALLGASAVSANPLPQFQGILASANKDLDVEAATRASNVAWQNDTFFVLVAADFGDGLVYQIVENNWITPISFTSNIAPGQSFSWAGATRSDVNGDPILVNGGWAPVPEPLTVGLALAGVALLIAQRKRK